MLTHHAHLVYANSIDSAPIPDVYKTSSVDVLHVVRNRFSIADARELSLQAQQKAFSGEKRVFVIATEDIAVESQNALLKLLEEPEANVLFYIIVRKTSMLLPTLRSRLHLHDGEETEGANDGYFDEFKKGTYAERLSLITVHTKEKDLVWIRAIVDGYEREASLTKSEPLMRSAIFARRYIQQKGASAKMILEELALLLPL